MVLLVIMLILQVIASSLKALANEDNIVADTLLPKQMFPRLLARAAFVAGTQKMFLILFRNILCPQQMFPSLRSPRNIMSNNVSLFFPPSLGGDVLQFYIKKVAVYTSCVGKIEATQLAAYF